MNEQLILANQIVMMEALRSISTICNQTQNDLYDQITATNVELRHLASSLDTNHLLAMSRELTRTR